MIDWQLNPDEHDWQATGNPIPTGMKIGSHEWMCSKCRSKLYLRNKPPTRPHLMGGGGVKYVNFFSCEEIILRGVHDS